MRVDQNNWLFTQHISKDFDHSVHNYTVNITVEVIYAVQSCRRWYCNIGFRLLNYKTNTQQLPSTTGSGYMNTENYKQFGRARPSIYNSRLSYLETYPFTLDPSDTGFYVAIRDTGTCVGIAKLRVYHYICPLHQEGLVLYPEAPAPVSGSVDVHFSCIDNASIPESESDTVTCHSNGTWSTDIPVCECNLGYVDNVTKCVGK